VTFFNKKEDVINIELTPYGRSLLAIGKLKPAYYAFFDDDILYDPASAGFTETQSNIDNRILQNTPRLRPQRCLESPEKLIYTNEQSAESTRPHTGLKLNYLTTPLGTSDQTSVFGPAWKSTFLLGEITGSVESVLTSSTQPLKHIPQINSTIEYKMRINNIANDPPVRGQQVSPSLPVSQVYSDGTYLKIIDEQIICQLLEKEGFLFKDGLEVSVYLQDDANTKDYTPLKFLPKNIMIKDGILLDEEGENTPSGYQNEHGQIGPTHVEYYVDFNTDKQIPSSALCKGIRNLKAANVQVGIEVDCPDLDNIDFDIYGTRVTEIEDCD
tara:strand:- start:9164 stop:10144 length:981 start_codon:yes stop_codon:yes gene_type:complete